MPMATPMPPVRRKFAGPFLDPVCRELVWCRKTHWRIVQDGVRYYFCDATCKRRFAREPGAYADGAAFARAHREAKAAGARPRDS